MNSNSPLISVIIPHLNQPKELETCLSSLQSQDFPLDAFEVIVVDNGSTSLPHVAVERYPKTVLLQELKPGPGPARNLGARAAHADIVAFIDADCRAHPEWLSAVLRTLQNAPPRTILGGDVQIWRERGAPITAIEAYESVFAYRFKLYIEQHGFSGTGNLVMRKSDFTSIGPFQGIGVAEDIEWGQRARAAGYTFRYAAEMIVFHPARQSLRELFVKWDRHIQHAVNAGDKNPKWKAQWALRAFAILISPVLDWIKVVKSDRIHGLPARLKAILVLFIVRSYRSYKMIDLLLSSKAVVWNRDTPIVKADINSDF